MEVRHATRNSERLEFEVDFDGGFPSEVVAKYRQRMQQIRAAVDERDFRALKSLRYKKLKGARKHQRTMRLNQQWRLVLEFGPGDAGKRVVIVGIEP